MPVNSALQGGIATKGTLNGQSVTYYKYKTLNVFEGDILVPENIGPSTTKGTGRSNTYYWWPRDPNYENITNTPQVRYPVVYYIDPSLPNQDRVFGAIIEWESKTNLRFIRVSPSSPGLHHMISFVPGNVCASAVG